MPHGPRRKYRKPEEELAELEAEFAEEEKELNAKRNFTRIDFSIVLAMNEWKWPNIIKTYMKSK